uniref:Uncharacterized protein n=1 Tax=Oryza brachyantha TaxID=4533 RepID=J3KZM5_ORYBR
MATASDLKDRKKLSVLTAVAGLSWSKCAVNQASTAVRPGMQATTTSSPSHSAPMV